MPHSPLPWDGALPGGSPVHVLGVGDSTVAGVGVQNAGHGLVAQFSHLLQETFDRGVTWRSVGESGATSKDILEKFVATAVGPAADVVLVSLGANDAKD